MNNMEIFKPSQNTKRKSYAFQVYSVKCVSKIDSIISILFHHILMGLGVFSLPFVLRRLWEYVCFMISSPSNDSYDSLAIVSS